MLNEIELELMKFEADMRFGGAMMPRIAAQYFRLRDFAEPGTAEDFLYSVMMAINVLRRVTPAP